MLMYDVKTQLWNFLEETAEVTLDEILSAAMQEADTDRLRPQPVSPRRGLFVAVGTAAAVLLMVGIIGSVVLDSRSTVSDTVAPWDTLTATSEAGSSATPPRLVAGDAGISWRKTEIAALAAVEIDDLTSLPGGGFAVVTREGGGVLWSRDGTSWQEADPDGVSSSSGWRAAYDSRMISALPGRVVVLNRATMRNPVVWVGDLASGAWESYPVDTEGLDFISDEEVAIATSGHEVLVVAKAGVGRVVWVMDPDTGRQDRSILPPEFSQSDRGGWGSLEAEWFRDRWVLAVGDTTAVSEDGLVWTTKRDEGRVAADATSVTSLTAGRDGLIATTCGGRGPHLVWHSSDGLEWVEVPFLPGPHGGYGYSDELGFVLAEDGRVLSSSDGHTWQWTLGPSWQDNGGDIAASGNSVLFVADAPFLLTTE